MRRALLTLALLALCLVTKPDAYSWYATWTASPVTVYVNPANAPTWMSADQVVASVQAAMHDWNTQGGANIQLVYGGLTNRGQAYDGYNVVSFSTTPKPDIPAIAFTFSQWDAALHLSDSDIVLYLTDGTRTFSYFADDQDCLAAVYNAIYVHDITTHEFGHVLGLGHSDVIDATMHEGYATCSQTQRSLEPDDLAGIQALYGATPIPDPWIPPPPITDCLWTDGMVYPLGTLKTSDPPIKNGQVGAWITSREADGWTLIGANKSRGYTTVTLQCGAVS